ncbi:LPXTG cell wall anchor domain-containing protein [Enterococcus sp. AZ196]|uniref:LPXTG cell wall anchor domain-containing protein n=1 Tax=Enterococcus sp. AZ196 TaxID=2774659 RepID=UPI003D2C648D
MKKYLRISYKTCLLLVLILSSSHVVYAENTSELENINNTRISDSSTAPIDSDSEQTIPSSEATLGSSESSTVTVIDNNTLESKEASPEKNEVTTNSSSSDFTASSKENNNDSKKEEIPSLKENKTTAQNQSNVIETSTSSEISNNGGSSFSSKNDLKSSANKTSIDNALAAAKVTLNETYDNEYLSKEDIAKFEKELKSYKTVAEIEEATKKFILKSTYKYTEEFLLFLKDEQFITQKDIDQLLLKISKAKTSEEIESIMGEYLIDSGLFDWFEAFENSSQKIEDWVSKGLMTEENSEYYLTQLYSCSTVEEMEQLLLQIQESLSAQTLNTSVITQNKASTKSLKNSSTEKTKTPIKSIRYQNYVKEQLPKTGDSDNNYATLGIIFTGISSIFFFRRNKFKF